MRFFSKQGDKHLDSEGQMVPLALPPLQEFKTELCEIGHLVRKGKACRVCQEDAYNASE